MSTLLFLIPILTIISAMYLYRHHGKREILKFDFVQFLYSFIIFPLLFVWVKTFIFFLLRRELGLTINLTELFVIDTALSVAGIYLASFVVIHSLTASFKLKLYEDPLYNLFQHSEYFHLWLSHIAIFVGAMFLFMALAILNVFIPFQLQHVRGFFYLVLFGGVLTGIISYITLKLADPMQENFMRLMKLVLGLCFIMLVIVYFVLDPPFRTNYVMYWFVFASFLASVICSFVLDRSEKANRFVSRFKHQKGWGENIHLFQK